MLVFQATSGLVLPQRFFRMMAAPTVRTWERLDLPSGLFPLLRGVHSASMVMEGVQCVESFVADSALVERIHFEDLFALLLGLPLVRMGRAQVLV